MSAASKLLGMWALGKTMSGTTPLLMRLLAGVVTITVLTIFSAILVTVFILGSIWLGYSLLVDAQVEPQMAMLMIAGALLALIAAAAIAIRNTLLNLRGVHKRFVITQSPIATRMHSAVDAFFEGLSTPPTPPAAR